ncbi:MAG: hypothetical protein L0Y72_01515 [Gemmataceae bacterium]|nr:hypothetical protein [Gemmataceae bacterium]
MDSWIAFEGTATDQVDNCRLTPSKGDGIIEVPKDDVRLSGSKVEVRVGTTATVVQNPAGSQPASLSLDAAARSDCPSGKTYCIGLLLFCCGSGKLLGPCIGGWGC